LADPLISLDDINLGNLNVDGLDINNHNSVLKLSSIWFAVNTIMGFIEGQAELWRNPALLILLGKKIGLVVVVLPVAAAFLDIIGFSIGILSQIFVREHILRFFGSDELRFMINTVGLQISQHALAFVMDIITIFAVISGFFGFKPGTAAALTFFKIVKMIIISFQIVFLVQSVIGISDHSDDALIITGFVFWMGQIVWKLIDEIALDVVVFPVDAILNTILVTGMTIVFIAFANR